VEALVVATSVSQPTLTFSVESAENGSFNLDLPPGTYEFNAKMVETGDEASTVEVVVAAGKTTSTEIYFAYP